MLFGNQADGGGMALDLKPKDKVLVAEVSL
jgi:hypothetical protein